MTTIDPQTIEAVRAEVEKLDAAPIRIGTYTDEPQRLAVIAHRRRCPFPESPYAVWTYNSALFYGAYDLDSADAVAVYNRKTGRAVDARWQPDPTVTILDDDAGTREHHTDSDCGHDCPACAHEDECTAETTNVIELYTAPDGTWLAEHIGPHGAEVAALFNGETTLPTPYYLPHPAPIRELAALNPDVIVRVRAPQALTFTVAGDIDVNDDCAGYSVSYMSITDAIESVRDLLHQLESAPETFSNYLLTRDGTGQVAVMIPDEPRI